MLERICQCAWQPAPPSSPPPSLLPTRGGPSPRLPSTSCPPTALCRYKIEQELGTEIKPIPPVIEKGLYCA